MVLANLVVRLSPTTALVALSSLPGLSFAAAHVLPRQTATVPLRQLDVLPWPLEPTAAPEAIDGGFLFRRQLNTVCGYVGGDPDLPATCSAGSHCVVDVELGAIGCCPDGGTCSQGVFTGCVDGQSPPQNEINPYVYTCQGDDLCYRNSFEGGFYQYGCGSTSGIITNVAISASGQSAVQLPSVTAPLTASAETLTDPTTLGTQTQRSSSEQASSTRASSTRSSASRSSSSGTSTAASSTRASSTEASSIDTSSSDSSTSDASSTNTSVSSTTTRTSDASETTEGATNTASESASSTESDNESATSTEASAPDTDDSTDGLNTGAIIGGTISGVAALVAFIVLGLWLWRRKKGNTRQGPGMKQQAQQVGPVSQTRHTFSPLPGGDDGHFPPPAAPVAQRAITPPERSDLRPDPYQPSYPYGYSATATAGDGTAVGGGTQMEHDQVPLTRELDDFSNGFNSALGRISEEEPRPGTAITSPMPQTYTPRRDGGGGALWQQNRGASWL